MLRRHRRIALVLAVAVAMGSTATMAGASGRRGSDERKITLAALYVSEDPSGTVGSSIPVTIHMTDGGDQFRVGFTEDEVGGTGEQWHAAGWNAATVGTLLTGSKLTGRTFSFDVSQRIDGPSPGALMTIGVIALIRGDKVKKDITMTGTINPDGTIGPVGGIPYKLDGVVEAHKTRLLIPVGQTESPDDSGQNVDVVALGREKGVKVSEVANIYDAYKAFTGKELPRPTSGADIALSAKANDRIQSIVQHWLDDFQTSANDFNALDPQIQNELTDITDSANQAHDRAKSLESDDKQAGAYVEALQSAAFARAALATGKALAVYLSQGEDAFLQQIKSTADIKDEVDALLRKLRGQQPESLSEADAVVDAYGNAFDAIALTLFGDDRFQKADQTTDSGDRASLLAEGAVYYEFAGTIAESADDLLSLGTKGGPKLDPTAPPEDAANFFRKAAEANLTAFDTLIVDPEATQEGVSNDQVRTLLASKDFSYALAQAGENLIENKNLEKALGGGKNAAFGDLGGSLTLYVRATGLIRKYYSLALDLNDQLEPTGTSNQAALDSALDFGQKQVERGIGLLVDRNLDPTLEIGGYQVAREDAQGSLSDQLDALGDFLQSFIQARMLAYLGGFPTADLQITKTNTRSTDTTKAP